MPWGWAALVGRESGEREEQAEKGRDEREPRHGRPSWPNLVIGAVVVVAAWREPAPRGALP